MGVIIEFSEFKEARKTLVFVGNTCKWQKAFKDSAMIYRAIDVFKQELDRLGVDTEDFPLCYEQLLADKNYHLPDSAKLKILRLFSRERAKIVIRMIRAMHKVQIDDNAGMISADFRGHEFLFLPLELRGGWQFSRDLEAIRHALPRFGLISTTGCCTFIEREFVQMQLNYLRSNGIDDFSSLVDYLARLGDYYPDMPEEVTRSLRDRKFAVKVALQIIDYNQDFFWKRMDGQGTFLRKAEA